MNLVNIAIIVSALSTVIYTVGTFLLWFSTKKAVDLTKMEALNNNKRLKTLFYTQMVTEHRDMFFKILTDKNMSVHFSKSLNTTREELINEFLGTWFINNVSQLFYHKNIGNIDDEYWKGIVLDIKDMFKWKIVSDRWEIVRNVHNKEFVDFVDKEILSVTN